MNRYPFSTLRPKPISNQNHQNQSSSSSERFFSNLLNFSASSGDGREIKNAIQNAAVMASGEHLEKVPAEYLLKAARQIEQSRKTMADAKKQGRESSGKGPGQYL